MKIEQYLFNVSPTKIKLGLASMASGYFNDVAILGSQLTKNEISKTFLKKSRSSKN